MSLLRIIASDGVPLDRAYLIAEPSRDELREMAGMTIEQRIAWLVERKRIVAITNIGADSQVRRP